MTAVAVAAPPSPPLPAALQRVRGDARIAVRRKGAINRLAGLHQAGSAKVRLPRIAGGAPLEAILLNTAGGLTGGDRLRTTVAVETGAAALVSTQAAERAYRSVSGPACVETRLSVESGGRLDWIPQETILFERSSLARRIDAEIAENATLLAAEAIVLGRTAMGERLRDITFADTWRLRRGGRIAFADGTRIAGDAVDLMAGKATGAGAGAFALVLLAAPGAEAHLDAARAALAGGGCTAGASAWNGILVARILAPDGQALRTRLVRLIETLRGTGMPRVWHC